LDLSNGSLTALTNDPGSPDSRTVIGFDANNTHLLAHSTSAAGSGYQDRISVYNFDPKTGAITLNNSQTMISGRSGDYTLFGFANNILWALSDGVMSAYSFDPLHGTLSKMNAQFNVTEDFQVPFAVDELTNTIIQPAAQGNQLNSYSVNQATGSSTGSHGPYQAGTAPWALAIAHVQ
jgi:6-phosphogluconolactonase (cycloisomerase 2 family)